MDKGFVEAYYGEGREDASVAWGRAIQAAVQGKSVIHIRFMKEQDEEQEAFFKNLEPKIKMFRFEKAVQRFEDLSPAEMEEEKMNIQNALNFARKVLVTKECQVLILEGILECQKRRIIAQEEIAALAAARDEETHLILTGGGIHYQSCPWADQVIRLETVRRETISEQLESTGSHLAAAQIKMGDVEY